MSGLAFSRCLVTTELHSGGIGSYSNTLVNRQSLPLMPGRARSQEATVVELDVTSLHHRRAVHRWERMSVGDLLERMTWSRPDKVAIAGRPGAYADERYASVTYLEADELANQVGNALLA